MLIYGSVETYLQNFPPAPANLLKTTQWRQSHHISAARYEIDDGGQKQQCKSSLVSSSWTIRYISVFVKCFRDWSILARGLVRFLERCLSATKNRLEPGSLMSSTTFSSCCGREACLWGDGSKEGGGPGGGTCRELGGGVRCRTVRHDSFVGGYSA